MQEILSVSLLYYNSVFQLQRNCGHIHIAVFVKLNCIAVNFCAYFAAFAAFGYIYSCSCGIGRSASAFCLDFSRNPKISLPVKGKGIRGFKARMISGKVICSISDYKGIFILAVLDISLSCNKLISACRKSTRAEGSRHAGRNSYSAAVSKAAVCMGHYVAAVAACVRPF